MFSRLFGKRDKSEESPSKEKEPALGSGAQPARQTVPEKNAAADVPARTMPALAAPMARQMPEPPKQALPSEQPLSLVPLDAAGEMSVEQRKNDALAVVELHHQRIANTIRTLWGYKECSIYINKLIMAGGDGMGHARVGFNQDAVQAMLTLSDLHDSEFGPPDSLPGGLGL